MSRLLFHLVLGLALAMVLGGRALAQHPIPESERWARITHAGNAPYPNLSHDGYPDLMGRVDYEFDISRTEVTATEWLEFVRAYVPYMNPLDVDSRFTSSSIRTIRLPDNQFQFEVFSAVPYAAVDVTRRFAARYANWLHNDKRPEQWAFETGAYDTSTFGQYSVGTAIVYTDQITASPGARFRMPTMDEWVKSAYWDPDRYGEGQPGYWQQPNGTDIQLISGPPGIGQTSGDWDGEIQPAVAAYGDVQSPWSLFDLSGGYQEWIDAPVIDPAYGVRGVWQKGSWFLGGLSRQFDDIDRVWGSTPREIGAIRLVRPVPSPQCVPGLILLFTLSRRRFRCSALLRLSSAHSSHPCSARACSRSRP
jgi:formylglycine-generating enzyme required for sulfatase activity